MSKRSTILLYIAIAIIVVAIVVYLRRYILPERLNDKIDDMTIKGSIETQIYNAALERLNRKFKPQQAKLLASLMVAQSKQESGSNYNSNVAKQLNNVLGYKVFKGSPYQLYDKSIAAVDGGSSAHFKSIGDCAREVADWISRGERVKDFAAVTNATQYVDALFKYGYTPMHYKAVYVKNVNSFFNQMQNIA